jgi:hypothetical protein
MAYDLLLEPQDPYGCLRYLHVEEMLRAVPAGAEVRLELRDCEEYEPDVPALVALRLLGCTVSTRFRGCHERVAREWSALYDRARLRALDVEIDHLLR